MIMLQYLIISLLTFFSSFSDAREPAERWLIELRIDHADCLEEWWENKGWTGDHYLKKAMPLENWWVVVIPANQKENLEKLPCILQIREDRKIEWRDIQPNDPAYINQKDMNLIGMPKAWDITTGGVTSQGDTIVVAVIDDGYQIDHEDLIDNIWVNRGEIPGDGVDNDLNGYTDDYRGINITDGNDTHPVRTHGTSVCGVIGARGNNSIGVAGVNWEVKFLLISQANFESQLIESYQYVVDMRKRYRQSNGSDGAFVVATNLSGGVDFAFAEDHPLWCGMYDKLGQEGILNLCAAPNKSISVDEDGDMPTTCTSPFMIAVTNVDLTDALVANAGFGPISIDLGAPGHGTITASVGQYKEFPGTSAATPHVTGAVALLYSTPCESFLYDVKTNPSATATRIKDIIFNTAEHNNSLDEITVTGRRLQVDAALRATVEECGEPAQAALKIHSLQPNPVRLDYVEVYFGVLGDTSEAFFELYAVNGARVDRFPISGMEFSQGYIRINTGPLPAGIYLLSLRNQKEKVTRKLFIY